MKVALSILDLAGYDSLSIANMLLLVFIYDVSGDGSVRRKGWASEALSHGFVKLILICRPSGQSGHGKIRLQVHMTIQDDLNVIQSAQR